MGWEKSRHNKNALRVLRQRSQSEFEYRTYKVKRIRKRSTHEVVNNFIWYDLPQRARYAGRNWKSYRKNQWK